MDHHHTFDFVEGTIPVPIAPEIKAYYPETDSYFNYFDWSPGTMRTALDQLESFIALEGPYDGVIGYSHGGALAATFLIKHSRLHPGAPPPFKCAIFLSGGIPMDPDALEKDEVRPLDGARDGALLALPTANIWGRNDQLWPGTSEVLSGLCEEVARSVFVHDEGHDVPSARAKDAVLGAVKSIRRTVDRALSVQ
ncbi:Serine hydrolase FSH [Lasallia pustulata]|uniref:Serine hydrolase FSH n=1 Tax=Lasallia pustulata TaxID=136370 RepID=A0A1W5D120_9LECA|nr:Serine hydrolase FSH [Lasallia pustulata]